MSYADKIEQAHWEEHMQSDSDERTRYCPPVRYVSGWNMPGYLPESEPATFCDPAEAVAYLVNTVERFWDQDYESAETSEERLGLDDKWLPVHTDLHTGLPVDSYCGDMSLHFWIMETTE
jgi:hypothetical protein